MVGEHVDVCAWVGRTPSSEKSRSENARSEETRGAVIRFYSFTELINVIKRIVI